jgi:hypothetical protein
MGTFFTLTKEFLEACDPAQISIAASLFIDVCKKFTEVPPDLFLMHTTLSKFLLLVCCALRNLC